METNRIQMHSIPSLQGTLSKRTCNIADILTALGGGIVMMVIFQVVLFIYLETLQHGSN